MPPEIRPLMGDGCGPTSSLQALTCPDCGHELEVVCPSGHARAIERAMATVTRPAAAVTKPPRVMPAFPPGTRRQKLGKNQAQVIGFLREHPDADWLEISQGTGLQGNTVPSVLWALHKSGMVLRSGRRMQYRYRLAGV